MSLTTLQTVRPANDAAPAAQPRRRGRPGQAGGGGGATPMEALVGCAPGDARWHDVMAAVAEAAGHLGGAGMVGDLGRPGAPGFEGWRDGLAVLHAVQLGLAALEGALRCAMAILDEDAPAQGPAGVPMLVRRAARALPCGRPALLPPGTLPALEALVALHGAGAQAGEAELRAGAARAAELGAALSLQRAALWRALGGRD